MAKIDPKYIIERHEKYPTATETLIESYAFEQYKKAISDLEYFGKVVEVENTDVVLVAISRNDYKQWKELKLSNWYLNGKGGI